MTFPETGSGQKNICPQCDWVFNIKAPSAETKYQEGDFEGGYPFTRALEMMEAILIAIGVTDKKKVVQVWEEVSHCGWWVLATPLTEISLAGLQWIS